MSSPELRLGASTSSTDVHPNPNIPNQHRPWPNISNRRQSQANNLILLPKLSAPAPQLILTDVIPNQICPMDVGDPSISVSYRAALLLDDKSSSEFSNRIRCHLNYPQLTPQIPEIFSTNTRALKLATWTNEAVSNIESWPFPDTLVGSTGHLYPRKIARLYFMVAWFANPLNVQITIMVWSYPICACTLMNPCNQLYSTLPKYDRIFKYFLLSLHLLSILCLFIVYSWTIL